MTTPTLTPAAIERISAYARNEAGSLPPSRNEVAALLALYERYGSLLSLVREAIPLYRAGVGNALRGLIDAVEVAE